MKRYFAGKTHYALLFVGTDLSSACADDLYKTPENLIPYVRHDQHAFSRLTAEIPNSHQDRTRTCVEEEAMM